MPSWSTRGEGFRLWFARGTLRKTVKIALVVGTILTLINQASVIAGGDPGNMGAMRADLRRSLCVSSIGFLSATRRPAA